jgi:hypothetical protein
MSSGSPRTGPNPRLKRGRKKKLSIGQKVLDQRAAESFEAEQQLSREGPGK